MSRAPLRWRTVLGPYLAVVFRLTLGVVFVVASLDKLSDPGAFARSIANYRILPHSTVNLLAICLPWVEVLCGLTLTLGLFTRASLLVVDGLLAVFIVAIVSALRRDLDIACGCFTSDPGAHGMTRWTLYWDIAWLAMGLHALVLDRGLLALPGLWRTRRDPAARGQHADPP